MIQGENNFDDDTILAFVIHPQINHARRQVQLCHNLIAKLFKKGSRP